jgi:hypothetical protein
MAITIKFLKVTVCKGHKAGQRFQCWRVRVCLSFSSQKHISNRDHRRNQKKADARCRRNNANIHITIQTSRCPSLWGHPPPSASIISSFDAPNKPVLIAHACLSTHPHRTAIDEKLSRLVQVSRGWRSVQRPALPVSAPCRRNALQAYGYFGGVQGSPGSVRRVRCSPV